MEGLYIPDDMGSNDLAWMPDWLLKICGWIFVDVVARSSACLYIAVTWPFRPKPNKSEWIETDCRNNRLDWEQIRLWPFFVILRVVSFYFIAKDAVRSLWRG